MCERSRALKLDAKSRDFLRHDITRSGWPSNCKLRARPMYASAKLSSALIAVSNASETPNSAPRNLLTPKS
ncbi:hypothetical protein N9Y50_05275 [Alphaproteobacteria bacterium]|nr:hypothetical protein [Alphaproteobacteria bacterium]